MSTVVRETRPDVVIFDLSVWLPLHCRLNANDRKTVCSTDNNNDSDDDGNHHDDDDDNAIKKVEHELAYNVLNV